MEIFAIKIGDKLEERVTKALLSCIDKSKRERLLKFVFWQDMQRSLYADLLIRKVIKERYVIDNEDISFNANEFGKPYYDKLEDFYFNVSHSGDWVVCAVDDQTVGIDVEKVSTIDLNISKNFFSNKEHEDLMLSNDPFDYFFTLWALKESYIKFIGKGLSHPLNSFSMKLSNFNLIYIESDQKILDGIFFKQYDISTGYKMAVCSKKHNMPDNITYQSIFELINTFTPQFKHI